MTGYWAACPEVQSCSCLPGQEHKGRILLRPHAIGLEQTPLLSELQQTLAREGGLLVGVRFRPVGDSSCSSVGRLWAGMEGSAEFRLSAFVSQSHREEIRAVQGPPSEVL